MRPQMGQEEENGSGEKRHDNGSDQNRTNRIGTKHTGGRSGRGQEDSQASNLHYSVFFCVVGEGADVFYDERSAVKAFMVE